jgi:EAL domain-containing protein (putative c-di-GMP-specific phosphodiesterase class I)
MREQQATDQARAERRRSASRRVEAVLASDRNGPTPESGIGLQIVYQPILDLTTGEVLGAEALSRFGTEPQRSPAQWFIEAAEVGLGIQLELAALRRAAEGLPLLPPGAFLSVNASAETIRSPALLNALDGLPGSRMVIELTEHEHVEDYEQLVAPVATLRERGVRLAVDDAGAGFASLQHILRLKPDLIKLDRTFIEGLADDPVRRALTTALITFARDIDATLVAEGIGTGAELDALRSLGVRHGQGLFLGAPNNLPFDPDQFAHLGAGTAGHTVPG